MSRIPPDLPDEIRAALRRAARLEWWTLGWMAAIVAVMGLALGGSQAFRTAWIEDMLSLLPPAMFLIALRLESLPERRGFPYGFDRAGSVAYFFSAVALSGIGGFLLYEGAGTLLAGEHPTVGTLFLWGHQVWMGWPMCAALAFSVVPPVILGRKKREVAKRLHDKVLFTDAQTNAADWQTGLAGIVGIVGIAFGLWWLDAAMAVLIALSVLRDGIGQLSVALIGLLDGTPRRLDSAALDPAAERLAEDLRGRYAKAHVQVRESGRYIRASVEPEAAAHLPTPLARALLGEQHWRLLELTLALRRDLPAKDGKRDPCL